MGTLSLECLADEDYLALVTDDGPHFELEDVSGQVQRFTPSDADLDAIREWAAPGSGAMLEMLAAHVIVTWLHAWLRSTEWWIRGNPEDDTCAYGVNGWHRREHMWADSPEDFVRKIGPADTVDDLPAAEWLKRLRAGGER